MSARGVKDSISRGLVLGFESSEARQAEARARNERRRNALDAERRWQTEVQNRLDEMEGARAERTAERSSAIEAQGGRDYAREQHETALEKMRQEGADRRSGGRGINYSAINGLLNTAQKARAAAEDMEVTDEGRAELIRIAERAKGLADELQGGSGDGTGPRRTSPGLESDYSGHGGPTVEAPLPTTRARVPQSTRGEAPVGAPIHTPLLPGWTDDREAAPSQGAIDAPTRGLLDRNISPRGAIEKQYPGSILAGASGLLPEEITLRDAGRGAGRAMLETTLPGAAVLPEAWETITAPQREGGVDEGADVGLNVHTPRFKSSRAVTPPAAVVSQDRPRPDAGPRAAPEALALWGPLARKYGEANGIPEDLMDEYEQVSMSLVMAESAGDPREKGYFDEKLGRHKSLGGYQLNEQGLGRGMSEEDRFDPEKN